MQPNVSFGAASYDFGTNEWGYLGNPDNECYEDIGYGAGTFANLQDIAAGSDGVEIDVYHYPKEAGVVHSHLNNKSGGIGISVANAPLAEDYSLLFIENVVKRRYDEAFASS